MKNREIFYISNLLSSSRFVLLILTVYFLITDSGYHYLIASLFIIVIWITDILDGYIARRRNEVSELGKIIDPLADKVTVITITLILLLKGILPLWFFAVIAARDILILSGGLYIKQKKGLVLQSNNLGKLAVFIIGFTLFNLILIAHYTSPGEGNFFLYHIENVELYWKFLILISIMMSVISVISYFREFLKTLSK